MDQSQMTPEEYAAWAQGMATSESAVAEATAMADTQQAVGLAESQQAMALAESQEAMALTYANFGPAYAQAAMQPAQPGLGSAIGQGIADAPPDPALDGGLGQVAAAIAFGHHAD
jgi:hypothetical protein